MTQPQRRDGPLRSYGRTRGRALSPRQEELFASVYPGVALPEEPAPASIDPLAFFPSRPREVWLEVGFGGAEHLLGQAARHSDVGFLGIEPFHEGVAKALTGISEQGLSNVRVLEGDARPFVAGLKAGSVARAFVLFPDPWPKTKHHKRRILSAEFVADLARVVRSGGTLRIATDWADYATAILEVVCASPDWRWTARAANDWRVPPEDHVTTRYQEKRLGDCPPVFLDFGRR
jgi:tRNA (guanine-N7-)-methyltransferase